MSEIMLGSEPRPDGFDTVCEMMDRVVIIRGWFEGPAVGLTFYTSGARSKKKVVARLEYHAGAASFSARAEAIDLSEFGNEDYLREQFMRWEGILHAGYHSVEQVFVRRIDPRNKKSKVEPSSSLRLRDHIVRAHLLLGREVLLDGQDDLSAHPDVFASLLDRSDCFLKEQMIAQEAAVRTLVQTWPRAEDDQ